MNVVIVNYLTRQIIYLINVTENCYCVIVILKISA